VIDVVVKLLKEKVFVIDREKLVDEEIFQISLFWKIGK